MLSDFFGRNVPNPASKSAKIMPIFLKFQRDPHPFKKRKTPRIYYQIFFKFFEKPHFFLKYFLKCHILNSRFLQFTAQKQKSFCKVNQPPAGRRKILVLLKWSKTKSICGPTSRKSAKIMPKCQLKFLDAKHCKKVPVLCQFEKLCQPQKNYAKRF